ncbi:hypothetical protein Trydic_g730 [Trypoxylus dichotomus]
MEQRAVIRFHAKFGKSALEAFWCIQQVYGIDCLSRANIFLWSFGMQRLEDDNRQERPALTRITEMIKQAHGFTENDRCALLKMMEEDLNIGKEPIRIILREDLGKIRMCAKFIPCTLMDGQKTGRNDTNFLKSVVTGDGTQCIQYDPKTKRQSAKN